MQHCSPRNLPNLFLTVLFAAPAAAAGDTDEFVKLAEGTYAHIVHADGNAVGNAGFVVLDGGILVFDSHFTPEAGQSLLAEIRKVSAKPLRYLVNSHFHPDHTHGNQAFGSGVATIGTGATRRDMIQKDAAAMNRTLAIAQSQIEKLGKDLQQIPDPKQQESLRGQIRQRREFIERMGKLKILPPSLALEDTMDLLNGENTVGLLFLGRGHTEGDLILHLREEKIVFAGDLFFNRALPNSQDACLLDWIQTLAHLQKLDAETFVPGHGPVGTRGDVREFQRYLEEVKSLVEPRVAEGQSLEQVLREVAVPEKYADYEFQNFFPANLAKMYHELKALQPAPADPAKKNPPGSP